MGESLQAKETNSRVKGFIKREKTGRGKLGK